MPTKSLDDVVVIDLTQMLAGPFGTQILADHGAKVIKIETFDGDGTRKLGPFMTDDGIREFGGYFQSVNRNKYSIALNLKTEKGKSIFRELVKTADVVVENFRSGVMDRLGLSYESLRALNPRLVYGAVRGFGDPRSGLSPYSDWPSYDVVSQAMGGIMGITGMDENSPTKIGPGVGDTIPALMLTIGLLSAIHYARRTGQGQFVDVAMTDAVLSVCERIIYQKSYENRSPVPEGNRHPLLCPFGLFRANDGWVSIACPNDEFWVKLTTAIGCPELSMHPDFSTSALRLTHVDRVIDVIESFTRIRSKAQIKDCLGGVVPFGPVYTANDIYADPHYAIREMIVEVEQPNSAIPSRIVGVPIKLSLTPGEVSRRAPTLGEHTDEVLGSLGLDEDALKQLRAEGVVR
jgi:crotonobetainyl-CoA:carnitine CoA-transferase CaiB-like acyl-CoA transferase